MLVTREQIKSRRPKGTNWPIHLSYKFPAVWANCQPKHEWWLLPPSSLQDELIVFQNYKEHYHDETPEGEAVRLLAHKIESRAKEILQDARDRNPLAFVVLSYNQALKANSWVWGITFICDFDANRCGKTAGEIIQALTWMIPNDPQWKMFEYYVDEWDRPVQVLQKPRFQHVLEIQKYLKANPDLMGDPKLPPTDEISGNMQRFASLRAALPHCFAPAFPLPSHSDRKMTGWQGAPDSDYHKNIVMPEWRKWLPKDVLKHDSEYDKKMELTVLYKHPVTHSIQQVEWDILFKSYESKDEKFSGAAVKFILLTEGIKQAHFNEIKQRFQEDAFASWDYTPYEARNVGGKSALAHRVFKGKEQLPLIPFIFTGFGIEKTPTYILPASKRDDLIRMWKDKPEGEARLYGNFYSSSPVALSNLDSELHILNWTKEELFHNYPDLRLYRGVDPGWDHPTACAWGGLNRVNTWFIYRIWSEANVSIGKRCEKIVKLSGNERRRHRFGQGEDDYYYVEVHPNPNSEIVTATFADYHTFETDQITERPYSSNYIKEGLTISRSVTLKPKQRAQKFDSLLEPSAVRAHPIRKLPPGAKIYFLISEPGVAEAWEKLENLFWERYATGDNKGEPKDELQDHDDDEFDAISYLVCSPVIWTPNAPRRQVMSDTSLDHSILNQFKKRNADRPTFSSTGY